MDPETPLPYLDVPDAFVIEIPDGWGSASVDGREYTLSSGDGSELRIDFVVYQAGDRRNVFVGFFYFKKTFVIAAGTASSDDPVGFKSIERMLWSIEAA
jgi:hypothetical protein